MTGQILHCKTRPIRTAKLKFSAGSARKKERKDSLRMKGGAQNWAAQIQGADNPPTEYAEPTLLL